MELLEKFYVYRSLNSDESWGAVVVGVHSDIPNADFLMKVFASNETEAIARARDLYEKVHRFDGKRDNVRRFAAAALKSSVAKVLTDLELNTDMDEDTLQKLSTTAAKIAMRAAIDTEKEYEAYFNSISS